MMLTGELPAVMPEAEIQARLGEEEPLVIDTNRLFLEVLPVGQEGKRWSITLKNPRQGGEYLLQKSHYPRLGWSLLSEEIFGESHPCEKVEVELEKGCYLRAVDISPTGKPKVIELREGETDLLLFRAKSPIGGEVRLSDKFSGNLIGEVFCGDLYTVSGHRQYYYRPKPGFYGVDEFDCEIEDYSFFRELEGRSKARVNKKGNEISGYHEHLKVCLKPNEFTFKINVLEEEEEQEDGDELSLYTVFSPKYGTVEYDSEGNILYSRNPECYGEDRLDYILTDGKGGNKEGTIWIEQKCFNRIPIQWMMDNELPLTRKGVFDDSDGDRLNSFFEYHQGTDPKEKFNPLDFKPIEGTLFEGIVDIPLYGAKNPKNINVHLWVDGKHFSPSKIFYPVLQNYDGSWVYRWDTTLVSNGLHTIQLEVAGGGLKTFGRIQKVLVGNILSFKETKFYGEEFSLKAEVQVPEAIIECNTELYDMMGNKLDQFSLVGENIRQISRTYDFTPEDLDLMRMMYSYNYNFIGRFELKGKSGRTYEMVRSFPQRLRSID